MKNSIGLRDIANAYVNEYRYRNAHPDLGQYHAARLVALCRWFKIDLAASASFGSVDRYALVHLLEHCAQQWLAAGTPFDGYLEAPKIIDDLANRHRAIGTCAQASKAAILDLIIDVLLQLYPALAHQRAPVADLVTLGWPTGPEPDILDYF